MRKNENQDLKSRISEKYHVFYDLPNLAQAPPVVKPKNKVLALIPLFSDVYRHSLDMDGLIRSALYSRWSALMYTDAVAQGVEINLYMEDTLLPSYKAVLGDNFIKASDVVYFSGASPTVHGNGTWGHLGKQTCPYWDLRLSDYEWLVVWDADLFFLPGMPPIFENLLDVDREIGYIRKIALSADAHESSIVRTLQNDIVKSSLTVNQLFRQIGFKFPDIFERTVGHFWCYPINHFCKNHPEFITWMSEFAPVFGNDEILAGVWSSLFSLPILTMSNELQFSTVASGYYFQNNLKNDAIHGVISKREEAAFRDLLKIV